MPADNTSDPDADAFAIGYPAIPDVDTHWSRVLYYDLFSTETGQMQSSVRITQESTRMNEWSDDDSFMKLKSPMAIGLVLRGIFVVLFLAVGGVLQVLLPPDAWTLVHGNRAGVVAPTSGVDVSGLRQNSDSGQMVASTASQERARGSAKDSTGGPD